MKKDLDEILKEKLRKENTDYNFKVTDNSKKSNVIYKLVASFSALFIVVFGFNCVKDLKFTSIDKGMENEPDFSIKEYVIDKKIDQGIRGENVTKSFLGFYEEETSIVIAKIDKILGYKNYSKKQDKYTYPITCVKAEVIKSLDGELNGTFDFYYLGGMITAGDYKKIEDYDGMEKCIEDDDNTIINLNFSSNLAQPKIESGKTYLLILRKDNNLFDMYTTEILEKQTIFNYDSKIGKAEKGGKWVDISEILDNN